jgi:Chalcone isomerase-like
MHHMKTNNIKFNWGFLMKLAFIFLLISLSSFSLQAKEVAGINIPENISFSDQSTKLVLNGAGIRTKFIFDIYIGSLYLEKKLNSAEAIYSLAGEKRISMHFLYDEIEKEKLISGWNTGFENNLTDEELIKFKSQIDQFNALFVTVKKGDVINLNFTPTTGTQMVMNSKVRGLVEGDSFFTALLKIWLGEEPADSDLKEAMLGSESS